MEKIQGKAKIISVEDAQIEGYDRARLTFEFVSDNESDDNSEFVTDFVTAKMRTNTFNVLVPTSDDCSVDDLSAKVLNKFIIATVWKFTIEEICKTLEGYESAKVLSNGEKKTIKKNGKDVDNPDYREYASLNGVYVGKYDDHETALANVRKNALRRLNDDALAVVG